MNILYLLYRVITLIIFVILIIPFLLFVLFSGKYRKHISERFGFIAKSSLEDHKDRPKIWIHAVSLGEIKVANSIITSLKTLMPGSSVTLSVSTEHGRALAEELLVGKVSIIYAPLDIFLFVKKSLSRINPDILIFLETEIWPAWIVEAKRRGVKIAMLNGRISVKSFKNYRRLTPFFKMVLSKFDLLSMISEEYRDRIVQIGAIPDKVTVTGNAKYEMLIPSTFPGMKDEILTLLQIPPETPVIVAGSTRSGEEEIILEAYKKIIDSFPDTVLILAPRHLDRVRDITELIKENRFKYHLRSELVSSRALRREDIIIIDCYGELFKTYSAATIAFCGASLVPLGGQNPLEPAAWGTPVFHGPHMGNFSDAMFLLKKHDAGIEVTGAIDMAEKVIYYLNNPGLLSEKGLAAKKALMDCANVSKEQATLIKGLLENDNKISG